LTGLELLPEAPAKGRRLGGEDVSMTESGVLFLCLVVIRWGAVGCASAPGPKARGPIAVPRRNAFRAP